MSKIVSGAVAALMLIGCFEGPTGPTGPRGEPGEVVDLKVQTGILYASTENVNGYWDVTIIYALQPTLMAVYTRQNSGFMWQPAPYYVSASGNIRILNDEPDDLTGREYRIVYAQI